MPHPTLETARLAQPTSLVGAVFARNAALIALACWIFGMASFETGAGPGFDKLIWLPSGIGLAAILGFGWRYWPALVVGGVALGLSHGLNIVGALVLGAAAGIEALIGAWLLRRVRFDSRCERLRDVLALSLVAFGAAVPASVLEYLALAPGAPGEAGAIVWWACFIGRALGALLIVPLALANTAALRSVAGGARLFELLLLVGGTGGLSLAVFASMGDPDMFNPLPYALFPLLFWGALRFGRGRCRPCCCWPAS
jgi:integral membrane sensor domain MASE1